VVVTADGRDWPRLKAIDWTGQKSFAVVAAGATDSPFVLAIPTPETTIRDIARDCVRQVLREALGILLGLPPEHVPLISQPGQAIRLAPPWTNIGLSVSHEPGLSLAAIHLRGPVGVDLVHVGKNPAWLADWQSVTHDYLGPRAAERIASQSPDHLAHAFANEWTRAEACLKCHGMQLQEWAPALERRLMRCRLFALDLPSGFIGMLATLSSGEFRETRVIAA
jgi:4'-phosphopantetheinyl transferase